MSKAAPVSASTGRNGGTGRDGGTDPDGGATTVPADTAPDGGTVEGEAGDTPPRHAHAAQAAHAAPVLSVDGFEGPLDWLLEMARARKIDLSRLSILELITAFEQALQTAITAARGPDPPAAAAARTIAAWGDWLVMAAELTLLRSRLLAASLDEAKAAAQQAEALRRQLLDRAMVAASAAWLDARVQLGRDVFARGLPAAERGAGRVGDVVGLLRACLAALALPDTTGVAFRVPGPPFWSVAQATARIRALLPGLGASGGELALFLPSIPAGAPERDQRCRAAVASSFLAGLALAHEGAVALHQIDSTDPILVTATDLRVNGGFFASV